MTRPKIRLAHVPTPLERPDRLAEAMGIDLWVKRDDATGGAEAGNKVRKLEYLAADAIACGADTLVTCGGVQSNHARATALIAARLGMRAVLYLRATSLHDDDDGRGGPPTDEHAPCVGNVMLDQLAGAELRMITVASYRRRGEIMARAAAELGGEGRKPYVIPEGGSNALGALGYVDAMGEVRCQLDAGEAGGDRFDVIVHACGSGGTAAGVALGAGRFDVAAQTRAMAVCDDEKYFEGVIGPIIGECRRIDARLGEPAPWRVDGRAKGPAYAQSSPEQLARMAAATRLSGLIFDPVYTGKALCGLWQMCDAGELKGKRVLFIHTGGLPGLLADPKIVGPLRGS
jgi:D-cysteine desulfhydrase